MTEPKHCDRDGCTYPAGDVPEEEPVQTYEYRLPEMCGPKGGWVVSRTMEELFAWLQAEMENDSEEGHETPTVWEVRVGRSMTPFKLVHLEEFQGW